MAKEKLKDDLHAKAKRLCVEGAGAKTGGMEKCKEGLKILEGLQAKAKPKSEAIAFEIETAKTLIKSFEDKDSPEVRAGILMFNLRDGLGVLPQFIADRANSGVRDLEKMRIEDRAESLNFCADLVVAVNPGSELSKDCSLIRGQIQYMGTVSGVSDLFSEADLNIDLVKSTLNTHFQGIQSASELKPLGNSKAVESIAINSLKGLVGELKKLKDSDSSKIRTKVKQCLQAIEKAGGRGPQAGNEAFYKMLEGAVQPKSIDRKTLISTITKGLDAYFDVKLPRPPAYPHQRESAKTSAKTPRSPFETQRSRSAAVTKEQPKPKDTSFKQKSWISRIFGSKETAAAKKISQSTKHQEKDPSIRCLGR